MNDQTQLNFFQVSTTAESQDDWTFKSANTREFSHCYHDYPARMIPQVAEKLLALYGNSATRLFDPYSGSGTSLVEANRKGINAIGTDLNPLARLIAKAKTTFFPLDLLIQEIRIFNQWALAEKNHTFKESPTVYGIPRLEFWFKPDVISALVKLREW
ncbi:MAG TPA: hypothetical protein PK299_14520 [Anaerolineales bacterium]|nr:hypothetical protein [Anaerolineales bacterium]